MYFNLVLKIIDSYNLAIFLLLQITTTEYISANIDLFIIRKYIIEGILLLFATSWSYLNNSAPL